MTAPVLESSAPGHYALKGPVTFDTAGALLQEGRRFAGQDAVTVNLAGVSKVDSSGLALMLEWLRQARAERRRLTFTELPDKLLAIARLGEVERLLDGSYSPASGSSSSLS